MGDKPRGHWSAACNITLLVYFGGKEEEPQSPLNIYVAFVA